MESKFKRPTTHNNDPEKAYRKGYQQGAIDALNAVGLATGKPLKDWINADLQVWRHDYDAVPSPPPPPKRRP